MSEYLNRVDQVRKRCAEIFAKANSIYGITLPNIQIRFDLKGCSAGQAGVKMVMGQRTYYMRFNVDMMRNEGWDHLYNDTIPHEIAHIVCFYMQTDRRHGPVWKRCCKLLGGSGERCHDQKVKFAKGETYIYVATCGTQVSMSEKKHRTIQASGGTYTLKKTRGKIHKHCAWGRYGEEPRVHTAAPAPTAKVYEFGPGGHTKTFTYSELPKAAEAPAKVFTAKPAKKGSNADQVRALITSAKLFGKDMDSVVLRAVTELGMSKALAKTYVKNNWEKA